MEPAESIVNAWLQINGYFTMTNVRVDKSISKKGGAKPEIDILAVKPDGNDKLHIEVSVSVHSFGRPNEKDIDELIENKFTREDKVTCINKIFGDAKYKKIIVTSGLDKYAAEQFEKNDIEITHFGQVIKELKEAMTDKSYADETKRFLGLIFEHGNYNPRTND